mmetsp:Transcript_19900/g.46463  ORF Transcript_19900/g.46463 Transcript_19900/m.46463 type:complete len:85 (-) Transcript_19900:960-1214(-)
MPAGHERDGGNHPDGVACGGVCRNEGATDGGITNENENDDENNSISSKSSSSSNSNYCGSSRCSTKNNHHHVMTLQYGLSTETL